MSQENVEVVRRIVQAWSVGDFDAARDALDPDITWSEPPQQPGGAVYHGRAGVEESIRNWVGAWDEFRYEFSELIDAGEYVLMIGRQIGRGKGSQVRVSSDLFHLWTVRDGRAVEMRMFMNREEALEAAGLRDQAMSQDNVAIVRSIFAAWERGDFSSTEWADTAIEFKIVDGPAPGTWRGVPGLADGFRSLVNAWENYRVAADEYLELDPARVLVLLHPAGRGRTSGLELEETHTRQANLFHLDDGKVIKLALYLDRSRALADLGLAPEAG